MTSVSHHLPPRVFIKGKVDSGTRADTQTQVLQCGTWAYEWQGHMSEHPLAYVESKMDPALIDTHIVRNFHHKPKHQTP